MIAALTFSSLYTCCRRLLLSLSRHSCVLERSRGVGAALSWSCVAGVDQTWVSDVPTDNSKLMGRLAQALLHHAGMTYMAAGLGVRAYGPGPAWAVEVPDESF